MTIRWRFQLIHRPDHLIQANFPWEIERKPSLPPANSQANTPGLTGTLEAFNWNSNAYDVVEVSPASFNTDAVVTADLSAGISDYVQTGSGSVRSRIGWRQTGFTLLFPWEVRLDQMLWTAN